MKLVSISGRRPPANGVTLAAMPVLKVHLRKDLRPNPHNLPGSSQGKTWPIEICTDRVE